MAQKASLSITDNRTGKSYEIPISHNAIHAPHLKQITAPGADAGLLVSDPGLRNTAVVESEVAYLNGSTGTLHYRSYSIGELYHKDLQYEDILHLLTWGHLPSQAQKAQLRTELAAALLTPADTIFSVVRAFPPTAPPMTMILAGLSAHLSSRPTTLPAFTGANLYESATSLLTIEAQIAPTLAALALVVATTYCHRTSTPLTPPLPTLPFAANVFRMLGRTLSTHEHTAIEKLWLLYADHGLANATAAFLHTASTRADPVSCLIAALSAGYGPLHGGAIDMVYHMLTRVGSKEHVPELIAEVKSGRGKLYGFGHRVYETVDPRAGFVKEIMGGFERSKFEIVEVAEEIERCASEDEWFRSRRIRMNVDLFGCFVYTALGLPPEIIFPLTAIARAQGYMARWREFSMNSPPIWRPQQIYTGPAATHSSKL